MGQTIPPPAAEQEKEKEEEEEEEEVVVVRVTHRVRPAEFSAFPALGGRLELWPVAHTGALGRS
jgi:hypothetical protein